VQLTPHIHAYLNDLERLAHNLASRPTRLAEIIPEHPSVIGSCDAAKPGMGGVLFCPNQPPLVWRAPFPAQVQRRVVSYDNPGGRHNQQRPGTSRPPGPSRCGHAGVRPA
jgi:hypothetical protein